MEKAYDRLPREELYWSMRNKEVPEKYFRLVKDMYHQCETVVRCAAGTSEPCAGSAVSHFLVHHDGFTDGTHKKKSTLADDVRG